MDGSRRQHQTMLLLSVIAFSLGLESYARMVPIRRVESGVNQIAILYDGRAPSSFTAADLDASNGPYSTAVKGNLSASHYFQLPGNSVPPTPLWQPVQEQTLRVLIDNSSVFTPGASQPQFGFRRGELIAQQDKTGNRTSFVAQLESGVTAFHFSVQQDPTARLNVTHEYQAVFIEPSDGTHIFDLQTGTPFNQTVSDAASRTLRIRSHNSSVLFQTPCVDNTWHNFAVAVDWDKLTLQVYYSQDGNPLKAVTSIEDNSSAVKGPNGQGDFHVGLVKLPLINPADSPANQADVAHFGLQEGSTDALFYSGVFVETAQNGISVGHGSIGPVGK